MIAPVCECGRLLRKASTLATHNPFTVFACACFAQGNPCGVELQTVHSTPVLAHSTCAQFACVLLAKKESSLFCWVGPYHLLNVVTQRRTLMTSDLSNKTKQALPTIQRDTGLTQFFHSQ